MATAAALIVTLLLGVAAGWEGHHLRVRGIVTRLHAASRATRGEHRQTVIADYARRLHIRTRH